MDDVTDKLDKSFGNAAVILKAMLDDIGFIHKHRDDSPSWRRNSIRTVIPNIEGICSIFRQIGKIYLDAGGPSLSEDMKKVIAYEKSFGIKERIKLSLKIAHITMCDSSTSTDFSTKSWQHAQTLLDKRHDISHPEKPQDLDVDQNWDDFEIGLIWLITETTAIYKTLDSRAKK